MTSETQALLERRISAGSAKLLAQELQITLDGGERYAENMTIRVPEWRLKEAQRYADASVKTIETLINQALVHDQFVEAANAQIEALIKERDRMAEALRNARDWFATQGYDTTEEDAALATLTKTDQEK